MAKRGAKKTHSERGIEAVVSLNRKGYGFARTKDRDYYLSAEYLSGAMDGDTVYIKVPQAKDPSASARVLSIKVRALRSFVGRIKFVDVLKIVVPRDSRIRHDGFVLNELPLPEGLQENDWVLADIMRYPDRSHAMEVRIVKKIADASPILPLEAIALDNDIELEFQEEALKDAEMLSLDAEQILVQEKNRRDYRDRLIFTIDPADAKDYDDAISLEYRDNRYYLGVHIADVSHFVKPNTALDLDALERGNSTYLPGRVIPMLPEALSSDLCSLMPQTDRLCFSVNLVLDEEGRVLSSDFVRSVIRSQHRLTYQEALNIIEGKTGDYDAELIEAIRNFDSLALKLGASRRARGGLDFASNETEFVLDEQNRPLSIANREATRATQMIEEAMILANESVASYLYTRKQPSIYRVHEEPDAEALKQLYDTLQAFAYELPSAELSARAAYQKILKQAQGRDEEHFVSTLLLRSLKRAYYSPIQIEHFGLASPYYTHFTSPIRRYADVVVHRILGALIDEEYAAAIPLDSDLHRICSQINISELNSKIAEREATDFKVAEYMKAHIGEEFSGIITSVVHFGVFVSLDNSADGLVHVKNLEGRYWSYEPKKHQLINADSGEKLRLGQKVQLRLKSVNMSEGLIDFELV